MPQASIRTNVIYRAILTISTYVVNLAVFPYISRVLGVGNVGIVNFASNTLDMFLLFATLGIGTLGVREIAAVKGQAAERDIVFSRLLGTNVFFTLIATLIYIAAIALVPQFARHEELFYVGTAKLISTAFLIEWFFTGMENFKYVTLRTVVVKLIYVAAVFLFVRQPSDYPMYFYLTIGMVVANALVNWVYARRFVRIRCSQLLHLPYFKDNIILGTYQILTSMYITFNVVFLGFVADDIEVGYYTTAFKSYAIILGFFNAFANVMLPRMSSLWAEGRKEEFETLISKSFRTIIALCVPLIVFSVVMAPQITMVLAGAEFTGAILPMRILSPALLAVAMAQVLAMQILMPMKQDRKVLLSSFAGASISLAINILAVPMLKSTGSAIVLLCSEYCVTGMYILFCYKLRHTHLHIDFPWLHLLKVIAKSVPCAVACIACGLCFGNAFVALAVAMPAALLCWGIFNYNDAVALLPQKLRKGLAR